MHIRRLPYKKIPHRFSCIFFSFQKKVYRKWRIKNILNNQYKKKRIHGYSRINFKEIYTGFEVYEKISILIFKYKPCVKNLYVFFSIIFCI